LYLCSLMRTSKVCLFRWYNIATITWDIVHTLLHLLGISNWSSFHHCPRSVCLVLKMVLTLKWCPMHLNFSETPLTCGRWVVGLFTGHCHVKGHPFKLGLTDNPTCERYLEKDESATHILCDCEAMAYLKFRHLCQFFMEPSDYYDAPINKVLHFIRSVGLING
jgi:hypothetical protein